MELQSEEIRYYRMSSGEQRKVVRAALKRWRERNPDKLPVTSLHHGWYGWVLESTAWERGIVANVMRDCIVPYLRETRDEYLKERAAQLTASECDGILDTLETEFPDIAPSVLLETLDTVRGD